MRCWLWMAWGLALPFLAVACASGDGNAADPWLAGEPALLHPKSKTGALYAESVVVDFDIGFTDEVWQEFLAAWKPIKDTNTWFHCSFEFAGVTFLDAACRHKSGSSDPISEKKPQFVVRFDKWDDTGRFFGVREINLEASPEFAAPVRDRIGMWVMRHAGIMAPRVNHARVAISGQPMGLYQNIEVIDHEFLEQRFNPPIGNLYNQTESGWHFDTNGSTGNSKPITDLEALIVTWKAAPSATYDDQLRASIDVSEVLRATAAEMVLPVCDNFSTGGLNFYLYQTSDGRFVLLPWDLDEVLSDRAPVDADLWQFLGNLANSNQSPGIGLDLRAMLFSDASRKAEYEGDVVAIRDEPYAAARDRVASVCAQIRPFVAEDPNAYGTLDDFDADCAGIPDRITQRTEYLRKVLGR